MACKRFDIATSLLSEAHVQIYKYAKTLWLRTDKLCSSHALAPPRAVYIYKQKTGGVLYLPIHSLFGNVCKITVKETVSFIISICQSKSAGNNSAPTGCKKVKQSRYKPGVTLRVPGS
jgi:hypothetical protein